MSRKKHWYKYAPMDFYTDTADLSLEEIGAYQMVLNLIYTRMAAIPDNDKFLASHLRISTRKWRSIKKTLVDTGKLVMSEGEIMNVRAKFELENMLNIARRQREGGASTPRTGRETKSVSNENNDISPGIPTRARTRDKDKIYSIEEDKEESPESISERGEQNDNQSQQPANEIRGSSFRDLEPPGGDWGALIWDQGLGYLRDRSKLPDVKARRIIGKWIKTLNSNKSAMWRIFVSASEHNPIDPVAYIAAAVLDKRVHGADPRGPGERPPHEPTVAARFSDIQWHGALVTCRENNRWSDDLGPAPWEPGCLCPQDVLDEYRNIWVPLQPKKRQRRAK